MSQLQVPIPPTNVYSVNGQTGNVTLSTVNIPETGNLYYTDARARAAISVTSTSGKGLQYNASTGALTLSAEYANSNAYSFVIRDASGNIQANLGTFSDSTVTNTLSSLNNAYFVNAVVTGTFTVTSLVLSQITVNSGLIVNGVSGIPVFADGIAADAATTTNLPEGTNQYFTQPRTLVSPLSIINPSLTGTSSFDPSLSGVVTSSDTLSSAIVRLDNMIRILSAFVHLSY